MLRLALPCLLFALLAGCGERGPSLANVSGTVTLDGQPLPNARVTFYPVSGIRESTGLTDPSGKYELIYLRDTHGAALGDHVVRIHKQAIEEGVAAPSPLPLKYNEESELTTIVVSGQNTCDFSLHSN
jgi:hypothetical protein